MFQRQQEQLGPASASPQRDAPQAGAGPGNAARAQSLQQGRPRMGVGGGNAARAAALGLGGGGGRLPDQASLESFFGVDLGGIRFHTGAEAADACAQGGADGLSVGADVATDGDPLKTVHEVAHAVQVSGGTGPASGDPEQQAVAAAEAFAAGKPCPPLGPAPEGAYRIELDAATAAAIRDARDTVGRQWMSIFANLDSAINNFANSAMIPDVPSSAGRAAWDYARDEILKKAEGAAGPLGAVAGYVRGLYGAVEKADKELAQWRGTVALTDYATSMRRAVASMRTAAETYYNGDGSAGHQHLAGRYEAQPEASRATWLAALRTNAQLFNLADITAESCETALCVKWINSNVGTAGSGRDFHRTGTINVTYKCWEDRSSNRLTLDSATLDVPGDTGILRELAQTNSSASSLADMPVQKAIWMREWDEDWLDEEIAAAFSVYGEDNGLVQGGTLSGDLMRSRIGRTYAGGSLANLPLTWSQVSAG